MRRYFLPLREYSIVTGWHFMVIPLSRSKSMESSSWSCISRFWIVPVASNRRSERVVLPWSTCAIMQKFLMFSIFSISARYAKII